MLSADTHGVADAHCVCEFWWTGDLCSSFLIDFRFSAALSTAFFAFGGASLTALALVCACVQTKRRASWSARRLALANGDDDAASSCELQRLEDAGEGNDEAPTCRTAAPSAAPVDWTPPRPANVKSARAVSACSDAAAAAVPPPSPPPSPPLSAGSDAAGDPHPSASSLPDVGLPAPTAQGPMVRHDSSATRGMRCAARLGIPANVAVALDGGHHAVDGRAVVQLCVATVRPADGDFARWRFSPREYASGSVVDAEKGLIATCAHALWPLLRDKRNDVPVMLCVGTLDEHSARRQPRWSFAAEVVHITEEGGAEHAAGHDVALLRVTSALDGAQSVPDAARDWWAWPFTAAVRTRLPAGAVFDFPALPLGGNRVLMQNERVVLCGYPVLFSADLVTDAAGVSSYSAQGHIMTSAFQHDGASGGPLLSSSGEVVGILSTGDGKVLSQFVGDDGKQHMIHQSAMAHASPVKWLRKLAV